MKRSYGIVPCTHDKHNALGLLSDESFIGNIHQETLGSIGRLDKLIQVFDHEFTLVYNRGDLTDETFGFMLAQVTPECLTKSFFILDTEADQVIQLFLTELNIFC